MYCLDLSWITHNGSQCSGTVQALHSLLARWVCRDGGLRGCLQREVAKSCITAQSGRSRVPLHAGTTPHGPPHLSPCLASSVMLPSCSRFHLFFCPVCWRPSWALISPPEGLEQCAVSLSPVWAWACSSCRTVNEEGKLQCSTGILIPKPQALTFALC